MAITEVHNRFAAPFASTVLIVAVFPDGQRAMGTGSLVGPNDVLTATHVLYSPDHGGWASDITLHLGVDYNSSLGRFESASLLPLDQFSWRATGWPSQVFSDSVHSTLTHAEGEWDVALLGISVPVGAQLGWLGLDAGYDSAQWAHQVGYPADSPGMMHGNAWVTKNHQFEVYSAIAGEGSDIMGPGSSGGPLYVFDEAGRGQVVGVKTSGSATTSHWIDIGHLLPQLTEVIRSNDELFIESMVTKVVPGNGPPQLATAAAERFEGSLARDVVVFSQPKAEYAVSRSDAGLLVASSSVLGDVDRVEGIERLHFADAVLALDVALGESAGQAYRLYQAAFDRQPDAAGLAYWIALLDGGKPIDHVAEGFVASAEFRVLYSATVGETFISGLYANVLHRTPDAAGFAYWMETLDAGHSPAGILALFSESLENHAITLPMLETGLWLS